ncbi:TetR/AcrR family transcriptional regulator [Aeromicrobium panaciterrae]|uniref:TetR/AcrR family transcriptional regulator n=1 Tax=Aeromicrobium panaciterrae TaxID=363861 RepID=UPI0031E22458
MEQKAKTARQRAREEITEEILAAARARLTSHGPGELSLRAVARDVGMVSSAVYRYFSSRDDLLTALLIEGYDALGEAVELADRSVEDRTDIHQRWLAACRAIRTWSIEHPGDYALLYGSPVPGYAAPQDTVGPATRVVIVLISIAGDAHRAGAASPLPPSAAPAEAGSTVAAAMEFVEAHDDLKGPLDPEIAVRTLMAWTTIFGTVSFELFGHLVGSVSDYDAYFDQVATRLGSDLGII